MSEKKRKQQKDGEPPLGIIKRTKGNAGNAIVTCERTLPKEIDTNNHNNYTHGECISLANRGGAFVNFMMEILDLALEKYPFGPTRNTEELRTDKERALAHIIAASLKLLIFDD
jgi:hypothetical protein